MTGKPQLPKESKSSHKRKCSCLSICAYFLIVVEMGLGLACTIIGSVSFDEETIHSNCYYYEQSSSWRNDWSMRSECTQHGSFDLTFSLGGLVIFSSGIIQIITRDKPEYGVLFSIVAMLFVMQNITTVQNVSTHNYRVFRLTGEFLLIPVSGIIYIFQKAALKKANEIAAAETVVSSV